MKSLLRPFFALLLILSGPLVAAEGVQSIAEAIRTEAIRPNQSKEGRPLPLASHWTTGSHERSKGWRPDNQMQLIEQGHYILPWFAHPPREAKLSKEAWENFVEYYKNPIQRARELKLPIVLIATQWERYLSAEPYLSLPAEQNPNVINKEGKILNKVSPFGPVAPWQKLGKQWTDNPQMKKLQEWYPDPPLVIFLSNNEHRKLRWTEAEESKRYLDKYGKGKSNDFKRRVIAAGWIGRYRALQESMRRGLDSPHWRKNAKFVGYDAFGPPHLGRWGGWLQYSFYSKDGLPPYPLMWDGGSVSYYTHNWNPSTDYKVWSPQIEFMNLVLMQKKTYQLNPNFWLEISVWDGHAPGKANDKRIYYASHGQTYTPKRYRGFIQFGMWLLRPRVVRGFRGWIHPWEKGKPYFMALVKAVDVVHQNALLKEWWRKGDLVPNQAHEHIYRANIPGEYKDLDRWFLLDADVNSQTFPWGLDEEIKVFSLALTQGKAPERQWLIYAHSPLGERKKVKIKIPEFKDIIVDVAVEGSFYLLNESTGRPVPVKLP